VVECPYLSWEVRGCGGMSVPELGGERVWWNVRT